MARRRAGDPWRTALFFVASAVATPPATTEVDLGGAGGEYAYTPPCSSYRYRVAYGESQARLRARFRNGVSAAAEGAVNVGRLESSVPPGGPDVGKRRLGGVGVLRLGFEGRYGGIELGGGAGVLGEDLTFVPSGRAWLGRWGVAHVWASVLARETMSLNRVVGVGLGHESSRVRLAAGLGGSAGDTTSLFGDADYRLMPRLWVGMGFGASPRSEGASIGLRLGLVLGGADRQTRLPTEEPTGELGDRATGPDQGQTGSVPPGVP